MSEAQDENRSINVAIVGGGIVGIALALGLVNRGVLVTIYERNENWVDVGAGIGFSKVAREAMKQLNPRILEALEAVSLPDPTSHSAYYDSLAATGSTLDENDRPVFETSNAGLEFWGCLRHAFLLSLAGLVPEGMVKFGKTLSSYVDDEEQEGVILHFADGSQGEADVVIGCDGIGSRTRRLLLGEDSPAARAGYARRVAYRALVPLKVGVTALGEKALAQSYHLGRGAFMITYPVDNLSLFNIVVHVADESPWEHEGKLVVPADRDELIEPLRDWNQGYQSLLQAIPPQVSKYAIFDTAESPVPSYVRGRVALAGDAAHAVTPDHGSGAGMGVEDALVLAAVLETATSKIRRGDGGSQRRIVTTALQAYNQSRYERSQWLVRDSREKGEIHLGRAGRPDGPTCETDFDTRHKILHDFDLVSRMATEAQRTFGELCEA